MSEGDLASGITFGEERTPMLDAALMLAFCLLMGLLSLAVCGWAVVSGQVFTLDGLLLILISLTIGGIFLAIFAWSVHNGELREVMNYLRKKSNKSDASSEPPAA